MRNIIRFIIFGFSCMGISVTSHELLFEKWLERQLPLNDGTQILPAYRELLMRPLCGKKYNPCFEYFYFIFSAQKQAAMRLQLEREKEGVPAHKKKKKTREVNLEDFPTAIAMSYEEYRELPDEDIRKKHAKGNFRAVIFRERAIRKRKKEDQSFQEIEKQAFAHLDTLSPLVLQEIERLQEIIRNETYFNETEFLQSIARKNIEEGSNRFKIRRSRYKKEKKEGVVAAYKDLLREIIQEYGEGSAVEGSCNGVDERGEAEQPQILHQLPVRVQNERHILAMIADEL